MSYDTRVERAENILRSNPEYECQNPPDAIVEAVSDLLDLAKKTYGQEIGEVFHIARSRLDGSGASYDSYTLATLRELAHELVERNGPGLRSMTLGQLADERPLVECVDWGKDGAK